MSSKKPTLLFCFGILLFLAGMFEAVALPHSKDLKAGSTDIELTEAEISSYVTQALNLKVRTQMPQVDILNLIYRHYRENETLLEGERRIVISGLKFARAYRKMERAFNGKIKEEKGLLHAQMVPPEIQYGNFKAIILYCRKGRTRMRIDLEKPYEQELPHTFGAKIILAKVIEAELRADKEGGVTEVLFDGDSYVRFVPPGIAFFIPEVFTKIARISNQGGVVWGHVIGRPRSAPHKYVKVSYNLSTCAKSSISSKEMAPLEYSRKIVSLD